MAVAPFTCYLLPITLYLVPKISVEIATTLKNKLDPHSSILYWDLAHTGILQWGFSRQGNCRGQFPKSL